MYILIAYVNVISYLIWWVHFSDDQNDRSSSRLISELEKIDDDLDQHGVTLVKMTNDAENSVADRFQVDQLPALLFFDQKFPKTFTGMYEN